MNAISLRQHINKLGFTSEHLDKTGNFSRIRTISGQPCFETLNRVRRLFSKTVKPIPILLPTGAKIKFLCSLKYDVIPNPTYFHLATHPFHLLFHIIFRIGLWRSGENINDLDNFSQLQGAIEMFPNPPYSEFPFDQKITIYQYNKDSILFMDNSETIWKLPPVVLSTVNQIEVCNE